MLYLRTRPNRKWIKESVIKDGLILEYRETRTLSTQGSRTSGKWMEYATEEEKLIIADIVKKCQARMEEARRPLTEEEKLRAKIAKLNEQLAKLKGDNN